MINRINEVLGGLYYVSQANKVNKQVVFDKAFKRFETERVEKIQEVTKLNALNEHDKEQNPREFLKTEVVESDEGKKSVILTCNQYGYRQVNIVGKEKDQELNLLNPFKIKAAYFNDDL